MPAARALRHDDRERVVEDRLQITVEVKIAKGKESAFRYLSGTDAGSTKEKK